MPYSNFANQQILDLVWGGVAATIPAEYVVRLYTAMPDLAGAGGDEPLNWTNYVPVVIDNDKLTFNDAGLGASGAFLVTNKAVIDFGTAALPEGVTEELVGGAIWDDVNNLWLVAQFPYPKVIANGVPVTIPVGWLIINHFS